MARYCLLGRVRPDRLEEYAILHQQVWPELLEELAAAGWRNYSLFLRPDGTVIGFVEADDLQVAQERMDRSAVNARWQAMAADYFVTDGSPDRAWELVPEVFHLETQLARHRAGAPS
jgi:L-rhamnose mutarotase